jgi:hypothetical protein
MQNATLDEARADRLCGALNLCFGRPGAEAEYLPGVGNTGRVLLTSHAALEVIADRQRIVSLEARVEQLARPTFAGVVHAR